MADREAPYGSTTTGLGCYKMTDASRRSAVTIAKEWASRFALSSEGDGAARFPFFLLEAHDAAIAASTAVITPLTTAKVFNTFGRSGSSIPGL